ncbi:MAG: RNA polymerase sigma factor RpoD/SigA [Methylovulum sp.]|nr:RNA polymerase sigma factor RpoD/SigA [Methylovulum sp.]
MAYLTEHLSRQESSIVVTNSVASTEGPASVSDRPQDATEHCNFQVARNLKAHKTRLIEGLSEFSVTALWLLNEYEKNAYVAEQDEESSLMSDLAMALGEIKKHYLSASQLLSVYDQNHPDYQADKQLLTSALKRFPYSFEDLTKLTDLIAYACKFRGLCEPGSSAQPNKNNERLLKRPANLTRRSQLNEAKLSALLTSMQDNGYDEEFLFLSPSEMYAYAADIVVAEQLWLSARQQLAQANTKLVLFIANQYKTGFLDFDDLVQEGQTGLLKAVDKFDYRLGFQFSTYAGYWIRQAISRALSRCERLVRVPCGQVANINKVYRAKNEIISQTGQDPSVKELANYTKLSNDDINTILAISQTAVSLESSDDDDEAFAPIDFLEQQVFTHPFKAIAKTDLEQLLGKAIETLNPREAKVICAHFGVDTEREMTLQEIGSELNLTRERVRQIQVMALNKIKLNFGQQLLCFL